MYERPFPVEASPLSASTTKHVGDVGWEVQGRRITGLVYVPLALICLLKIVD